MKHNYLDFLKKLLIYTVILGVIGYLIVSILPDEYITPTLPYLFVFFFSVTLIVHYILLKVSLKRVANFVNYFMLLTFGKLIFFLSVILIYALLYRDDAPQFIISFFILYVFFTAFEVALSLSNSKVKEESTQKMDKTENTTKTQRH